MGFFDWSAPLFALAGERTTLVGADAVISWLRPFVPEGGRVIDVGGGTGALAARLAEGLRASVVVLDPTPGMLRHVPDRPDVTAVQGVAEEMPFESASFDAAVVSDAFHHFRDQHGGALELRRIVRPGGAVLVLELDSTPLASRILARVERLLGEPGAFFAPDELCAYMEEHGIPGTCGPTRGLSYFFLGEVRD